MAIDDERRQALGKLVRRARERAQMTIDKAAASAPMSPATWGNLERGARTKPFIASRVERVLGWPGGAVERYLEAGEEPRQGERGSLEEEASARLLAGQSTTANGLGLIDEVLKLDRPDSIKVDLIWVFRTGGDPIDVILGMDRDDHQKVETIAAYRDVLAHR